MSQQLDKLWQDPKHWKWHLVYVCSRDPRIVVPERHKWMGWTFNFGHRSAFLLTAVVLLVAVVPSLKTILAGQLQNLPFTIVFSAVFAIALVIIVSRVGRD